MVGGDQGFVFNFIQGVCDVGDVLVYVFSSFDGGVQFVGVVYYVVVGVVVYYQVIFVVFDGFYQFICYFWCVYFWLQVVGGYFG